jgi:hypothetical protein
MSGAPGLLLVRRGRVCLCRGNVLPLHPGVVRSRCAPPLMFSIPWPALHVAFARLQPLRVLRFALDAPRTHPAPRGLPSNQKQTLAAGQRLRLCRNRAESVSLACGRQGPLRSSP